MSFLLHQKNVELFDVFDEVVICEGIGCLSVLVLIVTLPPRGEGGLCSYLSNQYPGVSK